MKNRYPLAAALLLACQLVHAQPMILDSLTGPVTTNEINAFKTYMNSRAAPTDHDQNVWVYGNPGKCIEACGLMYETTEDMVLLNRMIYYCDAALSGRNDLATAANGGQRIVWTGSIEPVWPSSDAAVTPAGAGIEQGSVVAHMAFCSKLIFQRPALWGSVVPDGDPKGYGATYYARALKYMQEGDYVIDTWILPRFIRTSESNHYYFPGAPNTYKPNEPAPWNQAFMLNNAFVRLTECHLLLNDAPARVAQYDAILQPNLDWFFANLRPNTSASGTACHIWAYALPTGTEDANHFAYDAEGLWIAYNTGRYGISFASLVPFANTYIDVILATVTNGKFAGRVDGTTGTGNSGGDNYVRDEYLYLCDFRPESYFQMGNIEINTNKIGSSPQITARLLWQKNRRYKAAAQPATTAPKQAVILTPQHNGTASPGTPTLRWTGSHNTLTYQLHFGTSPSSLQLQTDTAAQNWVTPNLPANADYYWRIDAVNSAGTTTGMVNKFNTNGPRADSLSNNNRISGNGGLLTAQFTASKSSENFPGLTDLNTATKYFISNTTPWINYRSAVNAALSYYTIASANDVPTRDPKSWTLTASLDSITWVTLDTRTNESFASRRLVKFYEVNSTDPYKYFKLTITATNGTSGFQISEWNLYGLPAENLPVVLRSFTASVRNTAVLLNWQSSYEINNQYYTIERSADGSNYTMLAKVTAAVRGVYTAVDNAPLNGTNIYRLTQYDKDGQFTLLGVQAVTLNNGKPLQVQVWPNPAPSNMIQITINAHAAKLDAVLYDMPGRAVLAQSWQHSGGSATHALKPAFILAPGRYNLRVSGGGVVETVPVLIR